MSQVKTVGVPKRHGPHTLFPGSPKLEPVRVASGGRVVFVALDSRGHGCGHRHRTRAAALRCRA